MNAHGSRESAEGRSEGSAGSVLVLPPPPPKILKQQPHWRNHGPRPAPPRAPGSSRGPPRPPPQHAAPAWPQVCVLPLPGQGGEAFWNFPGPHGRLADEPCPRLPHISVPLAPEASVGSAGSDQGTSKGSSARKPADPTDTGPHRPGNERRGVSLVSWVLPQTPSGKPDAQVLGMRRGLGA